MKKKLWEIKQAAQPGVLEMYIYGHIQGDSYDWWNDETIET
ncbi:hypothetical protein [Anaerotalea alkaliphila]|nr:hypothetical protein [Anaerotalea alkaliphila]